MDDEAILSLFARRQEEALTELSRKYGGLCLRTARNILSDERDSQECVNDTWLRAWNAIPPEHPRVLPAWLVRVTRNLAVSRLRANRSRKRGGEELPLIWDELSECLPGGTDPQRQLEARELAERVNGFLSTLRPEERDVFVARYFYGASLTELSARTGWTEGKLGGMLHRTRRKLQHILKEEDECSYTHSLRP